MTEKRPQKCVADIAANLVHELPKIPCVQNFQLWCFAECQRQAECQSVVLLDHQARKNPTICTFYNASTPIQLKSGQEQWDMMMDDVINDIITTTPDSIASTAATCATSCPVGFADYGVTGGCYRLLGNDGSWTGTWEDAETQCNNMITSCGVIHLAGKTLLFDLNNFPCCAL